MLLPQIVILAGGLGTRLGSLTEHTPKPLLQVNGKPFLVNIIANLKRFGFKKYLLLCGYRGEQFSKIPQYFCNDNISIDICIESKKLCGTGGALLNARNYLDNAFILLNGDTLFDINYLDLSYESLQPDSVGKIALHRVAADNRYDAIEVEKKRVKTIGSLQLSETCLINAGVYYFSKEILSYVKTVPCSLEKDVLPLVIKDEKLEWKEFNGLFLDIGIKTDFQKAGEYISKLFKRRAIFLDRDGVINFDSGYTHKREQFCWIPGAIESIKKFNDLGYLVFVVTNQSGIARGLYTENDVFSLHEYIQKELNKYGAHIDDFSFCPYHPEGIVEKYKIDSNDRKPKPGMLNKLVKKWNVDTEQSLLIGDKETDIEAAKAAGIAGYQFDSRNLLSFVQGIFKSIS